MNRWMLTRQTRPTPGATAKPTRLTLTALEERAVPAAFQVTSNAGDTSAGSLRAVLAQVNASIDPTNVVTFLPGLTGPIVLGGDLTTTPITKSVDIQGPGAAVMTISGAGNFKLFSFDDGTAAAVMSSISGLTLTGGKNATTGGGGVYSKNENVTVTNAVVRNNSATGSNGGGVRADGGTFSLINTLVDANTADDGAGVRNMGGTFVISGSQITNNVGTNPAATGGYYQDAGALQDMTNSTVVGNTGGNGAGLFITGGPANIVNSLIANNLATNGTGSTGGGLAVAGGAVVLKNVTVTGNKANADGGGIRFTSGTLEIRNSTVALNIADADNTGTGVGGGLFENAASKAKVFSTILAKNQQRTDGTSIQSDVNGQLDSTSASDLIGVDTGLTGVTNATQGNLIGTAMTPRDPLLNALAFNGGTTQTLAIQSKSDAKDAGDATGLGLTTDGRGFARVVGPAADIGAFEIQAAPTALLVTTAADRNNAAFNPADLSLREALRFAGADAPTVTFAPALNGQTITLSLGRLVIDRAVSVQGPGAAQLTVSGNNVSQVLFVNDGSTTTAVTVNVSGLKLANGKADNTGGPSSSFGGGLINFENLTLSGVTVSDSQAVSDGGGIDNEVGGTLVVTNSTVTNNKSGNRGGGVFNFSAGTVSIQNSTISNNLITAGGASGGGVGNVGTGPLIVSGSTISGNKSVTDGGGIFNANAATVSIKNSTVSDNQANNNGGGLAFTGGTITINNSTVAFNKAEADNAGAGKGGGIFFGGGTAKMVGTIVAQNTVGTTGASLDIDGQVDGTFSLVQSTTGWNQSGSSNNKLGLDPLLGALQANGGLTFTRALLTGSPALDPGFTDLQINPDAQTADQRGAGFARKVGTSIDIGAFEFAPNTPPTITAPANQTTATGVATAPAPFTVGDAETAPAALVVTAASSNPALVPAGNVTFGGAGASRTVTVTPAAGQTGTATVTLTVTDAGGLATSTTFTVTVTAVAANTAPTITAPANQTTTAGVATAALAFTVGDAETAPAALVVTAASSNPAVAVALGGTGASRTVTVTPPAGAAGTVTVTLTVTDAGGLTATQTFTVTYAASTVVTPPVGPRPVLVGVPLFAAGTDAGTRATATLYNADKSVRFTVSPFGDFSGGVRVAVADFNGDGVADLAVGTGPGRATQVVVLDGVTQKVLFTIDPFEASFTGGVYVAAGDTNGDGVADLVITPDQGGGPRVRVFAGNKAGATFAQLADFFGIDDKAFFGGARAGVADLNGDGVGDLIVSAGFGGGPRVAGFNGLTLGAASPVKLFGDFLAFEADLRNGAFVTGGDLNGDGFAEIVAGGGPGGGPRVTAFSGQSLLVNQQVPLANFFAGDVNSRGGVRVAVKNLDGDTRADIVVGSGSGAGSRVTAYAGKAVGAGTPAELFAFDAFAGFAGGVFVG